MIQGSNLDRIKLLIALDSLGEGGAQRVTLNLIRYINKRKFDIDLVLLNGQGDYLNMLPKNVKLHSIGAKRARYATLSLYKIIKKAEPQIIFSSLLRVDIAVTICVNIPGVNRPKIILRASNFLSKKLKKEPFYTYFFSRWAYNNSNRIIASTLEMKHDINNIMGTSLDKIKVISNPVDIKFIDEMSHKPIKDFSFEINSRKNFPLIISMGRLTNQKGYSYLLKAFQKVRSKLPVRLVILGRGDKKEELENLSRNLNIDEYVTFLGFQSNPYGLMARADLFVLSSLWEGFPNALIEAMTCRIPVISTDCSSGPKEIITSGINGLLVPVGNVNVLADAILRVLTDKELSNRIAKTGRERVIDFEVKKIVREYEKLFISTMDKNEI